MPPTYRYCIETKLGKIIPKASCTLTSFYTENSGEIPHYLISTVRQYQNVSNSTNIVSYRQNDKVSECRILLNLWTDLGSPNNVRRLTLMSLSANNICTPITTC